MAVKLGNGNWAVKEDKLLAYNDNSGLFFNKEFDFSRGTSATYVAKDGLIKTAGIQPNIVNNGDFSDGTNNWETEGNSSITVGTYEGRSNVANINILNTSTSSRIRQPFNYVNGKKYKVTVNVFLVSGSFRVDCRDSFVSGDFVSTSTTGSWLTLSAEIDAISTGTDNVWLRSLSAVSQFYVDNISVQEIQTDTPRIDFTNDTKGHLLLEPSRTNLLPYSEDFTQWTVQSGTTITSNTTETLSPSGEYNASKIVSNGSVGFYKQVAVTGVVSRSIYLKSVTGTVNVKLKDPALTVTTKTLSVTENWQRFELVESNGHASLSGLWIDDIPSSGIYAWGGQLESGDFSTSLIPTTGATSTRNADVCNNSGSAQDFNSEEGVLYAELSALANGGVNRYISLSDNTSSNRLQIIYSGTTSNRLTISGVGNVGGVFTTINHTPFVQNQFNKIAIKYSSSGCKVFVNGSEVGSNTDNTSWVKNALTTFDLTLWNQSTAPFIGKVRNAQVFTEALTDEQLEKLTS